VDVEFVYRGQAFVWDQFKALSNLKRHGVSFEQSCEVFFDVREDEAIRIISAWRLSRSEKSNYEQRGAFEDANEGTIEAKNAEGSPDDDNQHSHAGRRD